LGEPDNLGLDGIANDRVVTCEPSPPEPVAGFGEVWCLLEQVPTGILNYPIEILCPGETSPPNTVTTNLTNTGATQSQIAAVDCSSFDLIGPTSGITPRPTTFEWTSAPGASDYEIVFYNYFGGVAQTFFTTETTIHLNVGEIPTGSELQWEVRAWQNGQYACVTARTPLITRLIDPLGAPPSGSGFAAYMTFCSYALSRAGIAWSNAPDGSVLIQWDESAGSNQSTTGSGASGSTTISPVGGVWPLTNIRVSSGGTTFNLGSC
jgi:hypothetical protein